LWRLLGKVAPIWQNECASRAARHVGKLHVADYEASRGEGRMGLPAIAFAARRRDAAAADAGIGALPGATGYAGFIVVWFADDAGLKAARVRRIRELLGIEERTMERWRACG